MEHMDSIIDFMKTNEPRRAVVVGAGFIGLEMAENLHALGLQVDIVEMAPQVFIQLDEEMAALVHARLRKAGVEPPPGPRGEGLSRGKVGWKSNSSTGAPCRRTWSSSPLAFGLIPA